jgi:hypothetical protein
MHVLSRMVASQPPCKHPQAYRGRASEGTSHVFPCSLHVHALSTPLVVLFTLQASLVELLNDHQRVPLPLKGVLPVREPCERALRTLPMRSMVAKLRGLTSCPR